MKIQLIIFSFISTFAFAQQTATGYVFEDVNRNGIKDKKEKGIAHISVSNGVEVVQTEADGKYTLPVQDDNIIFVIKPSQYMTQKNASQLPSQTDWQAFFHCRDRSSAHRIVLPPPPNHSSSSQRLAPIADALADYRSPLKAPPPKQSSSNGWR